MQRRIQRARPPATREARSAKHLGNRLGGQWRTPVTAIDRRAPCPGEAAKAMRPDPSRRKQPGDSGNAALPDRMLLTVDEAAQVICVGRSLMYELIARGAIKTVRVGRLRRIRPAALAEYIASLGWVGLV
jgi:excisionase family DNA binding protein